MNQKKDNFKGSLVVELDNNRILNEFYWMIKKEINFEGILVDESEKRHNFEVILVVELDNNRSLKKWEWINMITTEFSSNCTG